jgi:hypothetical protein
MDNVVDVAVEPMFVADELHYFVVGVLPMSADIVELC